MKLLTMAQGTPEWIAARIGVATASSFDEIITPKTCEPSKSQHGYMARLLAEWFLNVSLDDYVSEFMARGREMEAEARGWYEFETDHTAQQVGFCLRDDGRSGASPDSLVDEDGALEIKCPSAVTHMGYLLDHGASAKAAYRCQCQGQLWVLERRWVDLLLFHPTLPRLIVRVERDDKFIAALESCVTTFCWTLDALKERFADQREAHLEAVAAEGDGQELV